MTSPGEHWTIDGVGWEEDGEIDGDLKNSSKDSSSKEKVHLRTTLKRMRSCLGKEIRGQNKVSCCVLRVVIDWQKAFRACRELKSVVHPSSIESIEEQAF